MTTTRLVRHDDLPQLADMIAGLAAHHGDAATITPDQLRRDTCGPVPWFTVIVAEGDGAHLHGYAAMTQTGQLGFGRRSMDIHHLFVCANLRGAGVGTALVAACLDHAETLDCALVTVGTHPDNSAAAAFYVSRGFVERAASGKRFGITIRGTDQPPT